MRNGGKAQVRLTPRPLTPGSTPPSDAILADLADDHADAIAAVVEAAEEENGQ